MKLTDFLISRQNGLSENIIFDKKTILFKDINIVIDLEGWDIFDFKKYDDFVSKYEFPKNDVFSKKDRDRLRQNIPRPQILINKKNGTQIENESLIAMYLYPKKQLTGDSILHIRSINKLEQMWIPYFVKFKFSEGANPKVYKKDFFEYCQSSDINFDYNKINDQLINQARLRILSFAFNQFILLMYVFDRGENELDQNSLNGLIDSIKSST